jgi:glucosamine 6-phosphate synthetase-like amidotransferase/phosphosugar isomerase protein
MCGLVGMAGFLEHKHKNAMKELLFLDSLRGRDSTGLTAVSREKKVLTRKFTVPGYEFIEYPLVDRSMCHADQLWIGHNRFKTTGDVSRSNAHPFEVLDENDDVLLVGAHNGTLTNKYEIERRLNNERFDTDSEALFNLLASEPNFKAAIKVLRGAWSLVWWDPTADSINFCRNNERPMTYAYSKDRKVLVWASEAWMIINACRRNGVELDKNDKGLSCYSTNVDTLYTLEIPQERNKELPEMKREGGYVGAPTGNFQQGWQRLWGERDYTRQDWWNEEAESERAKETAEGKEKAKTTGEEKQKVVTIGYPPKDLKKGTITGHDGADLSLEEFKVIKDKGCVWCGDQFPVDRAFAFLNEDSLVCLKCVNDSHPRGDCLRPGELEDDYLDDDIPFDLGTNEPVKQKNSLEYKRVVAASVKGAKAAIG